MYVFKATRDHVSNSIKDLIAQSDAIVVVFNAVVDFEGLFTSADKQDSDCDVCEFTEVEA